MRAGDADQFQVLRRISDHALAQPGVGGTAIVYDELRDVKYRQLAFTNDGDGAALDSLGGMIVAIIVGLGNRDKHVARPDMMPMACAAGGADMRRADDANVADQQIAKQ
jgi:hypothetical protein